MARYSRENANGGVILVGIGVGFFFSRASSTLLFVSYRTMLLFVFASVIGISSIIFHRVSVI